MAFHLPKEPIRTERESLRTGKPAKSSMTVSFGMMDDVAEPTGFFSSNRDPTRDQRPQDMDSLAKGLDDACSIIQKVRSAGS